MPIDLNTRAQLRKDLQECSNVGQMLQLIAKRYDLSKPLGKLTKGVVVTGLISALDIIGPDKR